MSGFTPGPWSHEIGFVSSSDKFFVAVLAKDDERCKADSRLIAAAPDLFEACNAVVEALSGRVHSRDALDAVAACRAAISRALGEGEKA